MHMIICEELDCFTALLYIYQKIVNWNQTLNESSRLNEPEAIKPLHGNSFEKRDLCSFFVVILSTLNEIIIIC